MSISRRWLPADWALRIMDFKTVYDYVSNTLSIEDTQARMPWHDVSFKSFVSFVWVDGGVRSSTTTTANESL
jgi:hypothetical protein